MDATRSWDVLLASSFEFNPIYHLTPTMTRFKLLLGSEEGDSESIIRTKALEKGVLALPGTVFLPSGRKTAYVRAAFSLLDGGDVDEALRRLREVIIDARRDPEILNK